MSTIIQHCIRQSIQQNPKAAAKEIPEILGHYITNNTHLNAVYVAAKRVLANPDQAGLNMLRRAVAIAESTTVLWDEHP